MGFIGDNPREVEFEPFPETAPIETPAPAVTPEQVPA